jgi:hypothetical protein
LVSELVAVDAALHKQADWVATWTKVFECTLTSSDEISKLIQRLPVGLQSCVKSEDLACQSGQSPSASSGALSNVPGEVPAHSTPPSWLNLADVFNFVEEKTTSAVRVSTLAAEGEEFGVPRICMKVCPDMQWTKLLKQEVQLDIARLPYVSTSALMKNITVGISDGALKPDIKMDKPSADFKFFFAGEVSTLRQSPSMPLFQMSFDETKLDGITLPCFLQDPTVVKKGHSVFGNDWFNVAWMVPIVDDEEEASMEVCREKKSINVSSGSDTPILVELSVPYLRFKASSVGKPSVPMTRALAEFEVIAKKRKNTIPADILASIMGSARLSVKLALSSGVEPPEQTGGGQKRKLTDDTKHMFL